jgi:hypothetical protein
LILIWIGAPTVKNMSEACLSDISLNSGVTNMTVSLPLGKRHAVHRVSSLHGCALETAEPTGILSPDGRFVLIFRQVAGPEPVPIQPLARLV